MLFFLVFVLQIPVNIGSYIATLPPKFVADLEKPPLISGVRYPVQRATPIKLQPKDWTCLICHTTETSRTRNARKHCNSCGQKDYQKEYRKRKGIGKKKVSQAVRYVMLCV